MMKKVTINPNILSILMQQIIVGNLNDTFDYHIIPVLKLRNQPLHLVGANVAKVFVSE